MAYVGRKYEETRHLSLAEVAKLMRAEVKNLQLPQGATVRVRCHHNSINITVEGMTEAQVYEPQDDDDRANFRRREYTPAAQELYDALTAIRSAYQRDDSDIQVDHFDVRFYGTIEFEKDWHAESRAKEAARQADRRAELAREKAEAAATRFYAVKTREGIAVRSRADDRRVALVKMGRLYRWMKPMELKVGEVEYLLSKVGYESVRYDRTTKQFAVRRAVTTAA